MADVFTPQKRSQIMRAVRGRDTAPEILVRRLVWGLGCRYRLCVRSLPGAPDIVLARRRKIIFIHGCFWHGHHCRRGARRPKTRRAYWDAKRNRNQSRDAKNRRMLRRLGWEVLVVWECQTRDSAILARRLARFLGASQAAADSLPTVKQRARVERK